MSDTTPTSPPSTNPIHLNTRLESFCIFQHNCRGSNVVFLSFCSIIRSRSPTLLVIQDPFLLNGSPPQAPGFVSLYHTSMSCPRVVFYLQADFADGASFSLEFFNSPYLLALNVQVDHTDLRVLNLYNISWDRARAILLGKALAACSTPTLVLGDFNIHHPTANPARFFKPEELTLSRLWFDSASLTGYSLINTLGEYTCFPPNKSSRPSVLDLAFANQPLLNLAPKWSNDLPPTGSDHTVPAISFLRRDPFTSAQSPNWDHIDWEQLEDQLKSLTFPPPPWRTRLCRGLVQCLILYADRSAQVTHNPSAPIEVVEVLVDPRPHPIAENVPQCCASGKERPLQGPTGQAGQKHIFSRHNRRETRVLVYLP